MNQNLIYLNTHWWIIPVESHELRLWVILIEWRQLNLNICITKYHFFLAIITSIHTRMYIETKDQNKFFYKDYLDIFFIFIEWHVKIHFTMVMSKTNE